LFWRLFFFCSCYNIEESLGSKDTEDEDDDDEDDEEEDEYETDDDEAPADGGNGTLTSLLVEGPLEDEEENADDYEEVQSWQS